MNYVSAAVVETVNEIIPNIREYILRVDRIKRYNPGSFIQLTLDQVSASEIWPESRTFSIASWSNEKMRFIIKRSGEYTSRIFNELKPGSHCTVKYPFGELFDRTTLKEKHLFLAGGVGITPFLGLGKFFAVNGLQANVSLLYSVKTMTELVHFDELQEIFENRMTLHVTREMVHGRPNRRISIADIQQFADQDTNVYVCGSKEFNKDFSETLSQNGYSKVRMDEWE